MSIETWLLFLIVSLAPVMSPGPGILFGITNALRYGVKTTIIIGIVNALGITALGLAVGFGLGALMKASMLAFTILKIFGAGYLIWLGIKIWRDRSAFAIDAERSTKAAPMRRLIAQALAISLTNPKAMVAIAALFPPFINQHASTGLQIIILAVSYGALCAANHVLIAYSGNWLRRFLTTEKRVKRLRRVTGGMFISFGTALAVSSRP
ncbi:LysE family translocator [Amylibacter sp. SFDW26]|uniref:LysE family translocator n=1 Tax=Amylibacter sp. SFDW26 TaxID=2652722 RepID=UPI0012615985|nr:LysE family translocator [Amylibacter sp. SFDW26]KAB7614730.1 LysE family translocator [Amylibacter sp. SFDW26]